MSLFRSERMGCYNLAMPRESAWEIMNALGQKNTCQFEDQNANLQEFNRPYTTYIQRCEVMEKKLFKIQTEMEKQDLNTTKCPNIEVYLESLADKLSQREKAEHTYFEEVEEDITKYLTLLNEQSESLKNIQKTYNSLLNYKYVLKQTREDFLGEDQVFQAQNILEEQKEDLDNDDDDDVQNFMLPQQGKLSYLAGIIDQEAAMRFKRLVFRVTQGTTWTLIGNVEYKTDSMGKQIEPLRDPETNEVLQRTVFLIVYTGGSRDVIRKKLVKICEAFKAKTYTIPDTFRHFKKKENEIICKIHEQAEIIQKTEEYIQQMLEEYMMPSFPNGNCSKLEEMRLFITKEKLIYLNLNKLKLKGAMYHGRCWIPKQSESEIYEALSALQQRKPHIAAGQLEEVRITEKDTPPTFFKEIVDTFGIAKYREVNPGLSTIVTFPFQFGMMFGDIGHGGLILTFAILLCLKKDKILQTKSAFGQFLPYRYMFLMMGCFAFYCGWIYNDFMSIPTNLWGSCYEPVEPDNPDNHEHEKIDPDCVYFFGIDPKWYISTNELTYMNSYKMKVAVIVGVLQMIMGVFFKALNCINFGNWLDFFFEFLPQIIFMHLTFGYMIATIFIKWTQDYSSWRFGGPTPPSLITNMINFGLSGGALGTEEPIWGDKEGQERLQWNFFCIACICVPWMLIPKPLVLIARMPAQPAIQEEPEEDEVEMMERERDQDQENQGLLDDYEKVINKEDEEILQKEKTEVMEIPAKKQVEEVHHEDAGEIVVHALIETIEFVLGGVSHTASYLRLWALSLAHSELAKVFYSKTVGAGIQSGSLITLIIGYWVLCWTTFLVLMIMDVMECCLHALRLHWFPPQFPCQCLLGQSFRVSSIKRVGYNSNPFHLVIHQKHLLKYPAIDLITKKNIMINLFLNVLNFTINQFFKIQLTNQYFKI